MSVLGTIRKASAVVLSCSWLVTIITALGAATAPPEQHISSTIAAEVLFGVVAATATLVYVVAALATHIDDTQWSIGYAERIVQRSLADRSGAGEDTPHDNIVPLRSALHQEQAKDRPHTGT